MITYVLSSNYGAKAQRLRIKYILYRYLLQTPDVWIPASAEHGGVRQPSWEKLAFVFQHQTGFFCWVQGRES